MTREALIALIHEAFSGVTREGAETWHEAEVHDNHHHPTAAQFAAARALDTESTWTELIESPPWRPGDWNDSWAFLSDVGLRYYIPPAMVCTLQGADVGGVERVLNFNPFPEDNEFGYRETESQVRYRQRILKIFSEAQSRATAEFVLFMALEDEEVGERWWHEAWEPFWRDYWLSITPDTSTRRQPMSLEEFDSA